MGKKSLVPHVHPQGKPTRKLMLLPQYVPQPKELNDPHDRQVFTSKCAIIGVAETIPYSVNGRNSWA